MWGKFWSWFQQIDDQIFMTLNGEWTHPWADVFFLYITNLPNYKWAVWGLLPAVILVWWWFEKRAMYRILLVLVATVALTDALGYRVIKPNLFRERPHNAAHIHSELRLPHSPQSGSFPSNHAMSTFAAATVLTWYYPPLWPAFFTLAGLTAYSRVYVGVHYPSDVIFGALIGLFVAILLQRTVLNRFLWLQPERVWRKPKDL